MGSPTLLDIVKLNGSDAVAGLIDETIKAVPEVQVGFARTIKGISYKTSVRTALPTSAYRNANEGSTPVKSTWENRTVECFILNPRWECDKAVADAYEDGAEAYIALEGSGMTASAFQQQGAQFYYGRNATYGGDAKGHPGLIDAVDSSMVVDAGGTTADTGSSVWAVRFGPQDVAWVYGLNGLLALSEVRVESIFESGSTTKRFTAYVQELLARPGLQVGSPTRSIGRIKKLTADSGKGLTDALLGSLLAKFPVGYPPHAFFATRRSLEQLRASRTATNERGEPVPMPTTAFGVPIYPTDAIKNVEALTL